MNSSPTHVPLAKPLAVLAILLSQRDTVVGKTYPEYCSTREQQNQRHIPSLPSDTPLAQQTDSITLKHVTTIIRHGSRTPWARHQCWDGYDDPSSDTATWECKLTSMMRPQSKEAVELEGLDNGLPAQATAESGRGLFFGYQKLYDANWSKEHPDHFPNNMQNELRGNCQLGQLVYNGYDQHVRNAKILQRAYTRDIDGYDQPSVGTLYDFGDEVDKTNVNDRAYDEPQLYFRSDDDERTMMSGQILLDEIFGDLMETHEKHYKREGKTDDRPVIRVHTADRSKDVLAPNPQTCPRLAEIRNEAVRSEGFRETFRFSDDAKLMQKLAADQFGGKSRMEDPNEAIDCVMTTVCEDKELPFVLDAEQSGSDPDVIDAYGENILDRFIDFNMKKEAFVFKYKNNAYSKLSTSPLWNEILAGLLIFTSANEYQIHKAWPDIRPKSKLALYSAHDTTIMSILASLGSIVYDNAGPWPPYASMLNIELFEIKWRNDATSKLQSDFPTGVAFRLVYNGKVLTPYVSGCLRDEDLCDIDLLVLHVYPFSNVTEWESECQTLDDQSRLASGEEDKIQKKNHHGSYVLLYLLGGMLCMVIGSFTTYLYMSKFIAGQKAPLYDNSLALERSQIEDDQKATLYGVPQRQEHHDII